ncbi:MAG: PDZ domain-containing protein [Ruminococcus sp.]|jgi:carboxyl-terminal processing protease|nr:PDZ domain-containing protein [Ruminococcus sp.]
MNKKITIGLAIALAAVAAALAVILTYNYSLDKFNDMLRSVSEKEENYTRISELDTFVRNNYINAFDEKTLLDSILNGYIAGIGDFYAEYYPADATAAAAVNETGFVTGLGITYEKDVSGYILVTSVIAGSDAEKVGLRTGDIISAVNNTDVLSFSNGYDEAVALLTGTEGTKVKLNIKRIASDGIAEYSDAEPAITKTEIFTVSFEMMDNIGYIKIESFNDRTYVQLKNAVNQLIEEGAESFIFDMRDNRGGSMANLQNTLDVLLGAGDIVTADYKNRQEVIVKTTEADIIKMPFTILINENTVGTSELFALALRDNAKGQIVGVFSAGQGLLQETHKLGSGGSVKLSVAVLKTKNSGNFDKIGVKPDFEIKLPEDITFADISPAQRVIFDTQLIKALEVAGTPA